MRRGSMRFHYGGDTGRRNGRGAECMNRRERKGSGKGFDGKDCWRRIAEEGLLKKGCGRRVAEEGLLKKDC